MQNSDFDVIHFVLCIGGFYFATILSVVLYMIFGKPSKEFMEELSNYHPPGHD